MEKGPASSKVSSSKEKVRSIKRSAIDVSGIPELATLPVTLDPEAFAKARTAEVMLLKQEIANGEYRGTRRVFQTLPRSMRRRAASYNIRRLPVRLREKALAEAAKDPTAVPKTLTKPPCRRRRRRPCNIEHEFGRRQHNKLWLDTHMWHAKRAHMEDHWGYRIAVRSNEKCLKSCIRASCSGCFLYDRSYFELIHVEIKEPLALALALAYFPEETRRQLERQREGATCYFIETAMYDHQKQLIGPVELIAIREDRGMSVTLAVHPLVSDQVMEAFRQGEIPASRSRGKYCIFDLEGSRSLETLGCIVSLPFVRRRGGGGDGDECPALPDSGAWMFSTADPRFAFPQKTSEPLPPCEDRFIVASSDLWNHARWDAAMRERKSEHQLNIARAQHVIPGTKLLPTDEDPRMPVLLLARSHVGSSGRRAHGWTVVVPAGWGRCLWRSLIFAKARFGGLKEYALVQFEHGRPSFPIDFPTATAAFSSHVSELARQLESKWQRTPPAKRINHERLGISSPFYPNFSQFFPAAAAAALHRCRIEMVAGGVPQYNARIYRETSETLIGLVTTGGYSQMSGKGVAIGTCLLSAGEPSVLPIPVSIQNVAGGPRRPALITRLV